jgi:hypothetical protein
MVFRLLCSDVCKVGAMRFSVLRAKWGFEEGVLLL